MSKRIKTSYPGVFYREARRIGGKGTERVYYAVFKKNGKVCEEKAGRQYADDLTPARAAGYRAERIEGKRLSRKELREAEDAQKQAEADRWTFNRLWTEYKAGKPELKGIVTDENRFQNYVRPLWGDKEPRYLLPLDIDRLRLSLLKTKAPGTVRNVLELVRGELFKLRWTDIDLDRGFIHIRDPKGGPDQVIPLNKSARETLETHPRSDSPFVFPGRGGRQRTDIKKQVNKIKKRAGIPRNFRALHGLRHVYASMLASSGKVDMYTLQKLLTHKSPLITQRYAHLRDETLKKASDLAGKLITQAMHKENKVIPLRRGDN